MGARSYIIKETENGKFKAVYGHWTANRIRELAEDGVTKEELRKGLLRLWEKDYKRERKREKESNLKEDGLIKDLEREELAEFINFEAIDIEVYAVIYQNGNMEIFVTLVSNFIHGAVRVKELKRSPYALNSAFYQSGQTREVIEVFNSLGVSKEEAVEKIREAYSNLREWNMRSRNNKVILAKNLKEAVEKGRAEPLPSNPKYRRVKI